MKTNRFFVLLSIAFFTIMSALAQDISKLENYTHFTAEEMKSDIQVVSASIDVMPCKNCIEEITEVESAVCYEAERFNDFIKTTEKLIKNEKIPLILASPDDIEYQTKIYATAGKIIILTRADDDFASISIIHGTPPATTEK